jgi:UDP-N-acetylglucosamine:LPS N-acetylglucosamine transferase
MALRDAWEPFDRLWVTFDKADSRALLAGEDVVHAHGPTNRNIPNLLRNVRLAHRVIRRERPAAVLSTGAGVAVPFAWIARLYGAKVLYVESVTRIEGLSLSARLMSPVIHQHYVQWPDLAERVPGARFAGNVLGP